VQGSPYEDRHGREVFVAVAKMTFEVDEHGEVSLSDLPNPVRMRDVPVNDKPLASIRYPSDRCDEKPGTDVVLVGTAHPAAGATEHDVSLRVEADGRVLRRLVRVYGPRVWYHKALRIVPGPPAPLSPTPLIYELAYGGRDATGALEQRNPVGSGFTLNRASLVGEPTPQLEDPDAPLTSSKPAPAGFGAIKSSWKPRSDFQGTHDEQWCRMRMPVHPVDFDPRFNCCAAPGLWSAKPLLGDEPIEVVGALLTGSWMFRLPRYAPRFRSNIRGHIAECDTHLDTLLIDADERRVELTWRAAVPLPRKSELLVAVHVSSESEDSLVEIARRKRALARASASRAQRLSQGV